MSRICRTLSLTVAGVASLSDLSHSLPLFTGTCLPIKVGLCEFTTRGFGWLWDWNRRCVNGRLEGALLLRSFILNFLGSLVLNSLFGLIHLLSMLKQL